MTKPRKRRGDLSHLQVGLPPPIIPPPSVISKVLATNVRVTDLPAPARARAEELLLRAARDGWPVTKVTFSLCEFEKTT